MSISNYYDILKSLPVQLVTGQKAPDASWAQSLVTQLSDQDSLVPPLSQQVFPGDTVVVALAANVPQRLAIVQCLIELLKQAGVTEQNISIVSTVAKPDELADSILWHRHDPADPEALSMVGVSVGGEPLYLNSHLANADVVLPVILAGNGQSEAGYLYPAMSSNATKDRLQPDLQLLVSEAVEAEKLVSPFYVIGVVPAPGEEIGQVIVDTRNQVDKLGQESLQQYWQPQMVNNPAMVGTVGSEEAAEDVVALWRGLQNASQLVQPHGPIVLLAQLSTSSKASSTASNGDVESEADDEENEEPDNWGKTLEDEENDWEDRMDLQSDDRVEESDLDENDLKSRKRKSTSQPAEDDWEDESDEDLSDEDLADDSSWVDDEDDWGLDDTEVSQEQATTYLRMLLDDLREHQPVFLVSNLDANQTEKLGFGTLASAEDFANLLKSFEQVGLLKAANRWQLS